MNRLGASLTLIVTLGIAAASSGELQEVEVGGSLEIYGNYYSNFYENADDSRARAGSLFGRPVGSLARDPDTGALVSAIRSFDGDGAEGFATVEQRTSLHLTAHFTDHISTFIEFDQISDWGDSFRSDYITGADGAGSDSVDLYQAYINVDELWGLPLQLRVGRQELILGNEWLVGRNAYFDPLSYLSFDGVRLTYRAGAVEVNGFWMKLNEQFQGFGEGDVDLFGLYNSYTGIEDWEFNLYWLLLRDGADIEDVNGGIFSEAFEAFLGLDNYPTTAFHTVGIRGAGVVGNFDLEVEIAYQFGDASTAGVTFAPFGYGDNNARYNVWAGQFSVGYSVDAPWNPYFYFGGEYYGGEDNRDPSPFAALNPFARPEASLSFNRLFSSWEVDNFLDGGSLSNVWLLKAGVSATPTEKLEIGVDVMYFETVDPFRSPVLGRFGASRLPVYTPFPWGGKESDSTLGVETGLWVTYAYSDDLSFEAGWSHFFTGEGLEDGNFVDQNGFGFYGGLDSDDGDYLYVGTKITF